MRRRDFVVGTALLAAPAMAQTQAFTNWPGARPVKIIRPFQSGGVA
jgi:tripartite-type tricarboxylate transporter receptor subunit TctC